MSKTHCYLCGKESEDPVKIRFRAEDISKRKFRFSTRLCKDCYNNNPLFPKMNQNEGKETHGEAHTP